MRSLNVRALIFLAAAIVLAVLTGVALYGVAQQANAKAAPPAAAAAQTVRVGVSPGDIAGRARLPTHPPQVRRRQTLLPFTLYPPLKNQIRAQEGKFPATLLA